MIYITVKTVDARHDTTLPREIMAIRRGFTWSNHDPISSDTAQYGSIKERKKDFVRDLDLPTYVNPQNPINK